MKPRNRSNETIRACVIGAAIVLAFIANIANADTPDYCVTNDSQLASALALAQSGAVSIKLKQNTYHLNSTVWNAKLTPSATAKFHAGSSLLGGYTNDTCTTRNIDVDNTVITDSTATPDDEVNILGDATIEGITFHLANGLLISADVNANLPLPPGSQLTIRRSVFTNTTGAMALPLEIYWNEDPSVGGTVRLVDDLLYGNTGGSGTSDAGAIFFFISSGNPKIELINNTVVDNGGALGGFGVLNFDPVAIYAYNNIFYGNAGTNFAVNVGNTITLVDNVIQTHAYTTPLATTPIGTTTADPKLDSFHKPIEAPVSPVINTGTSSGVIGGLPTTDIQGTARTVGSEPDRGAYESSIKDSVIQSVQNTNDSGANSLRAAILSANAAGTPTLVVFNLGANCDTPFVIAPLTPLPPITASIEFAGYFQNGSSPNDLQFGDDAVICVILDGSPHNIADGLMVPASAADAVQIGISGLAFSGFTHGAVSLYGGSGHNVSGSRIGGFVGGISLDPVGNGIIVGPGVHNVTIGGDPSAYGLRNIIGSATGGGIVLDGPNGTDVAAHDNQIINNFIGVGWNVANGTYTNRGNGGPGVVVAGPNNDVESNLIEYNGGYGVELTGVNANSCKVEYNSIGFLGSYTDAGSGNLSGIVVQNDAHDNQLEFNAIWFNTGTGVRIVNGRNNTIFDNQIFSNGGLGIDLAEAGVTQIANDSMPPTLDYANAGRHFPVITSAIGGHTNGTFSGTLYTTPGTHYVELFLSSSCDPSGYGEGEFPFTNFPVTTSGPILLGQAEATFSVQSPYPVGLVGNPFVTAIAIDSSGNTSEFSKCFTYVDDTVFADGFGN